MIALRIIHTISIMVGLFFLAQVVNDKYSKICRPEQDHSTFHKIMMLSGVVGWILTSTL